MENNDKCLNEREERENNIEDMLMDCGAEGAVYLTGYDYDTALIGITDDNRCVYNYDLMIEWLMEHEDWSYEDSVEWIDYNTIRSIPYMGPGAPIIVYSFPPEYGR